MTSDSGFGLAWLILAGYFAIAAIRYGEGMWLAGYTVGMLACSGMAVRRVCRWSNERAGRIVN